MLGCVSLVLRFILLQRDLGQIYHFVSDWVSVKSPHSHAFGSSRYLTTSLLYVNWYTGVDFKMSSDIISEMGARNIFLTWHWMEFSLHFFKTGVCEFLKLLAFLTPLPFQYTPGKQFSIWQQLYFMFPKNRSQAVCLFSWLFLIQAGCVKTFVGESLYGLHSFPDRSRFSALCLCLNISSGGKLRISHC